MRKLRVVAMKFEKISGSLYCREVYENDESFLILVEGSPTEFIKKIGRLKDGITQDDLNKAMDNMMRKVENEEEKE